MELRNCFKYVLGLLGASILFVAPTYAQEVEHIENFNATVKISQDTSINIEEKIQYYFPYERHGIYREIPVNYQTDASFLRSTKFTLNDLYYYQNVENPIKYSSYEVSMTNGYKILKIGDADTYISGDYIFIIDYTLKYANNYFDDYDEIYLDIIGDSWEIPISNVTADIKAPGEIIDVICYTGYTGSTEQDCNFEKVSETEYRLTTTRSLDAYEGLTFAIKMPKGTLEDTTDEQRVMFLISNIGLLLPIPTLILGIFIIKKKGKNKKLTIIPHYEAPKGVNPSFAGYIYKNSLQTKSISAEIINLAIEGYITIKQLKKTTYELERTEKSDSKLSTEQKQLLEGLFKKGNTVNTKKIDKYFYLTVNKMRSTLLSKMNSEEMYSPEKKKLKGKFSGIGIVFIVIAFLAMTGIESYPLYGWFLGFLVSGIMLLVMNAFIDRKGEKGNKMYYELLGLKMYINTAEKHRIEFHDNPEKFRGVFESLLPYAMIFNLEKKWAKEFEDIYKESPSWYQGQNNDLFNAYMLTNSLNSVQKGISAKSSPPGSAGGFSSSSSGSGFSGGSSGGGFGGGGGGSW
jgi:uncharacterized membrane protein YgcG